MKRSGSIWCAMLLSSCGGAGLTDEVDVPAEAAAAAPRGSAATTVAAAKAVSSLFVQEDPTLDITKTAGQNADAVALQLRASACATANVTHSLGMTTVSVDFGAGGCMVNNVGTVSGAVSATVSKQGGSISVALTFTTLDVNGTTLDGTFSVATSDDTSFTATADLTDGATHVTFNGIAVLDSGGGGVTLSGTGLHQTVSYTASGVHHSFKGCYADAGSLTFTESATAKNGKSVMVTDVVTFDSSTPSTGKVSVSVNGTATPETLPAYGSCPHA